VEKSALNCLTQKKLCQHDSGEIAVCQFMKVLSPSLVRPPGSDYQAFARRQPSSLCQLLVSTVGAMRRETGSLASPSSEDFAISLRRVPEKSARSGGAKEMRG
jgi:hypothetical protein